MSRKSPFITRLLDVLLPDDLHHLVGDLEEDFHQSARHLGGSKARTRLWIQVLRSSPYFIAQSLIWNLVMIINYLKVTWRNIRKSKGISSINILGLAVSMAVCLLIILFIVDQKSYDRFHEHSGRIYRVTSDFKSPSNDHFDLYATTPASLPDLMTAGFPEVDQATHVRGNFSGELKYEDKTIPLEGIYADTAFFSVFSFELLQGHERTALKDPGAIILTERSARRIFGDTNPMGKTVTALGYRDFTVTGVIKNGYKTHFRFEALVSFSTLQSNPELRERLDTWSQSIFDHYTYFLLKEGASIDPMQAKLKSLIPDHFTDPEKRSIVRAFKIQPLTGINLGPVHSNEIGIVLPNIIAWFLTGFASIIILIACFNYVSLTVARAITRSREVGVRKVMGAFRSNVFRQFLAESVVIALIALVLSVVILRWLLPEFNSLFLINFSESQITMDFTGSYSVYLIFIVFSVFVGIFAGFYPALYLSSFNPAHVLKGLQTGRGLTGQTLRKFIIVSQFAFSIIFIITAFILGRQFNYMINTDYGFTRQGIVNVALQDVPYRRFKSVVVGRTEVEQVAATSHIPALGQIHGVWMQSDLLDERIRAHSFKVDENYIATTGLNLIAGRNFNPDRSTDSSGAVILSTEAINRLNLGTPQDALGESVAVDNVDHQVIGVIENFISADPTRKGNPIVLIYAPDRVRYAIVRVAGQSMSGFLSELETVWAGLGSLHSLKYQLLDDQLRENPILTIFLDFLKVIGLLSVFSIFISCLGLLGMAMYSAEYRVKEIGIRKVLGATMKDIVVLLSREYLILILIAVSIGTPAAYMINRLWMQQVSNKAEVGWVIYVISILAIALLALLTIGSQTVRAARAKTVDNLNNTD